MFNIRFFNMDKLANYFNAGINVVYIDNGNAVVQVNNIKQPSVTELDPNESTHLTSHAMYYIHVGRDQIVVHGTDIDTNLQDIASLIENELHDLRVRRYSQEKACNALKRNISEYTAKEITRLAQSLEKEPDLCITDGYYNTLGERAFFYLVENGIVEEEEAYEYVYDVQGV